MVYTKEVSLLLSGLAAAVVGVDTRIDTDFSAVSWEDPRVDVFGVGPDEPSLWHKFWTGWDWQPRGGFERVPAAEASPPSTSSWGEGRFDIVYVNASGSNVLHKYYDGGWGPSWEDVEDLGGNVTFVTSTSRSPDRLDLVGRSGDSYVYKAWIHGGWLPGGKNWQTFGGDFGSDPAITSWGPGRLDVVGITKDGYLEHRYWQHGLSKWGILGEGPFHGTPRITSWGEDRLDIWALGEDGELNHLFWDGTQYQGWENLGGKFTETPQVVHWEAGKIDIIGKDGDTFVLKNFDGFNWNGWYNLATSFASEPVVLAKRGENFLTVLGIDKGGGLRSQIWSGYDWQPGPHDTWYLGDLSWPYGLSDMKNQKTLGPAGELK
ncbi:unnamed protein product [Clonostachys chloroleuca]|uniref:PLL-like beta propeller domain-containing protein n=1 Tax=Clonostachys chloroleuca TaxID=1926264 RepID=A0AA35QEB1_9HYPO|nr:unnamed protein product [Clonostachys chloroleuca]